VSGIAAANSVSSRARGLARSALRFAPNLRGSSLRTAPSDLLAGLVVLTLAVPQGVAYALVAGLPPEMGLLAAALPAVAAALLGSSRYLVTGPTNPTALVLGVAVVTPAVQAGQDPRASAISVGLLAGCMLAAFGASGLGRVSRFLSDSVVVGFATGTGLWIALRIVPALAAHPVPEEAPAWAPAIWPVAVEAGRALTQASPRALALALSVPALVLLLRRIDRRVPGVLIALVVATLAAIALGWTEGEQALATLGELPAHGWGLSWPGLPDLRAGASPALAVALIVMLQSVAAARSLGVPPGERLDPDRELFAQGVGNVVASCAGAMPSSGSLSRSALARSAGARSRLAAMTSGLGVLLVLPFLAPILDEVPMAALVGLVALSGVDLISPRALRRASMTRGDAVVLIVTLGATLSVELVEALYAGVVLSLLLLVRRAGRLQISELARAGDRFREIPLDLRSGTSPAVLLHVEGDLNFAVAGELAERILEVGMRGPRVLVLRVKRAQHLDATVLEALRDVVATLHERGTRVVLCGMTAHLDSVLGGSELAGMLGREGLLPAGERLFDGFEVALSRARELLAPSSDEEIFRTAA